MYFGGDVYSSVDPFATALGTKDGKVSFIGSDEAALAAEPDAINLDGDFLTPGFVHGGLTLGDSAPGGDRLLESGFTHVHVLGGAEAVADFRARAPQGLRVIGYPEFSSEAGPASDTDAERASIAAADFLALDTMPETSLYIQVESNRRLGGVLDRVREHAALAQRNGYRLLLNFSVDDDFVTPLGYSGIAITLDPAQPQPLAQLLSAGAQVSWTDSQESPWAAVRSAVVGENGIGARAAFNAGTRFAHRAAGNPDGGVLAPGAEADLVRWQVDRLVVQVADERVAAWSTDPRSGTPGLPELSPEVALPTRIATVGDA
ncbi:metal-dependent hydrolase [Brevibacterium sp. FME37]|uniref:metal-dependent hydrolase n=1 Tax=Brevibacterium sp. FME37 TaxID=2742607 RepID=UPI001868E4F7|nr:metal-dependent hydrolase [Brevibacterium sp. FME37]